MLTIGLVVADEQGKKEEAINVFKKLIFQDQVLMVFGPTLSNSAQAADPIAQAAKTGTVGDGKIFITDLERAVRIRTGETDDAAL